MKKLIPYLISLPICMFAQKHDYHWIYNYPFLSDPSLHFDFNTSPPTIFSENLTLPFNAFNITMSDFNGNLLFYSNGLKVMNAANETMENGDSLNWNEIAEYYTNIGSGYASPYMTSLPAPDSDSLFYIISPRFIWQDTFNLYAYPARDLLYSLIDVSANNGMGKVLQKNMPIGQGVFSADSPNSCKHANGRDWWYIAGEDTASVYYKTLLTPEGFSNFEVQSIGYQPTFPQTTGLGDGGGQNIFSPDGSRYVDFDAWNGIRIFDFDRCSGNLSNPILITFPQKLNFGAGAAISPNSRFLYVDSDTSVYQFDLWAANIAASIDTVAIWDGFYTPGTLNPTGFYLMQLMPDNKIYMLVGTTSPYFHYISNPDIKGDGCNVVQHETLLPDPLFGIPTFPNYRLYDLPDSPCDTLGIDGPPTATQEVLELPEGEIVISPNPASTSLHINSVNCPWQPREVVVYDAMGREVLRRAHPASVRSYTLALPELADGVYFCRVSDGRGRALTQPLAVLRR